MSEDSWLGTLDILRSPVSIDVIAVWALVGVAAASALFTAGRFVAPRELRHSLTQDVSLLIVGVTVGWIFWSSLRPAAEYYKYVHEVVANATMMRERRMHLQVHGRIVPGSIGKAVATNEYRFQIESTVGRPWAILDAHYIGWVPETFVSGNEIVAKGRLDGDGRLEVVPDGIMMKCPSKYAASQPSDDAAAVSP